MIEIMIVIAIMAIVMTVGIPSMYRAFQKDDLAKAVHDTIEGCKAARDRAILQGIPYEFVIKAESGEMNVVPAPGPVRGGRGNDFESAGAGEAASASGATNNANSSGAPYATFPRKLGEDVMVQLVDVNFTELMDAPEARARFYPNGTSDEFTIVYAWHGKQETVKLDVVTGMADRLGD